MPQYEIRTKVVRIPSGTALATQVQQSDGTYSTTFPLLAGQCLVGIMMPAGWTAAGLTARVSVDGIGFADAYDAFGAEIAFVAAASRFISVEPRVLPGVEFLQLRSGTTATPVNQAADRDITLLYRVFD